MNKIKIYSIATLTICTGLLLSFESDFFKSEPKTSTETNASSSKNNLKTSAEVPTFSELYSKETDYSIVEAHGRIANMKSNLEDMYGASDIVAKVMVKEQKVETLSDATTAITTSTIEILKQFKGDPNVTSVDVTELGGPFDTANLPEYFKQKPGANQNKKAQGIIEQTIEGSLVMKKGNTYIVFLEKVKGLEIYNLAGSIQGKIKIDTAKNIGVITVDEHHIDEKSFFLQKEFAGKAETAIEQKIQSLKK